MMEIAEFEWTQGVLIEALVKGAIALGIGCLAVFFWRRASAATKHLVLMSSFVAAVLVPLLTVVLPKWEIASSAVEPRPVEGSVVSVGELAPAVTSRTVEMLPRAVETPITTPSGTADVWAADVRSAMRSWNWEWILFGLWSAGLGYCLLRLLASAYLLRGLLRVSRPVTDTRSVALLGECQQELNVTRNVSLRWSDDNAGPLTCGLMKAVVLLPANAADWTDERLRVVLLHELAHIRRHDVGTHLLARIVCAFYWFNPFAWLALRRSTMEREQACDDLVLKAGIDGPCYASHLVDLARAVNGSPSAFCSFVGMAQRVGLERRVESMLRLGANRGGVSFRSAVCLVTMMIVGMVPLAMLGLGQEESAGVSDQVESEAIGDAGFVSEATGDEFVGEQVFGDLEKPRAADGGMIVKAKKGRVQLVDPKTKRVVWVTQLGTNEKLDAVEQNGNEVTVWTPEKMYTFDLKTGKAIQSSDRDDSAVTTVFHIGGLSADHALEVAEVAGGEGVRASVAESPGAIIVSGPETDLREIEKALGDTKLSAFEAVDAHVVDIDEDGDGDLLIGGTDQILETLEVAGLDEMSGELNVQVADDLAIVADDTSLETEALDLVLDAPDMEGSIDSLPGDEAIVDTELFGEVSSGRTTERAPKGVKVTISEIGGVSVDHDMMIQAQVVGDRFENVTLLVDQDCPFSRVTKMIRELKDAGIPEIRIATKGKAKRKSYY